MKLLQYVTCSKPRRQQEQDSTQLYRSPWHCYHIAIKMRQHIICCCHMNSFVVWTHVFVIGAAIYSFNQHCRASMQQQLYHRKSTGSSDHMFTMKRPESACRHHSSTPLCYHCHQQHPPWMPRHPYPNCHFLHQPPQSLALVQLHRSWERS